LARLPAAVDPCGENGEYHTFCYAGPIFKQPIKFTIGEKVYKPLETKIGQACGLPAGVVTRGFWFCDFLPL
jgi:diphthamide synthase (EF-2-diphthine--ammonia ligase)